MEELGNTGLEEVMSTSTIYEDGERGVIDNSDETESLGGGKARESMKANVRGI